MCALNFQVINFLALSNAENRDFFRPFPIPKVQKTTKTRLGAL
jgi:hypothetical protein